MDINKSYEITFKMGQKTTVKLIRIEKYDPSQDHYCFEYLENESRKPVTPTKGTNYFHFPGKLMDCLTYKEI